MSKIIKNYVMDDQFAGIYIKKNWYNVFDLGSDASYIIFLEGGGGQFWMSKNFVATGTVYCKLVEEGNAYSSL